MKLLDARPQLAGIVWKVGETSGVLSGELRALDGQGELVDVCAEVTGGTVVRSTVDRGGDRQGVAQVVTDFAGVQVHAWVSYPLPGPDGLTDSDRHELLRSRPLGALVLPGGSL